MNAPTALIADDEPLLRERLAAHLRQAWPELQVVAQARNGREVLALFEQHAPQVVFLDVQMPGVSGIDAARALAGRTLIVFVTAFERYAVAAFEHGALDYLVKPFDPSRLAACVERLRRRLQAERAPGDADGLRDALARLCDELQQRAAPRRHLQWIKASVGHSLRLIAVQQVAYLRSDEKYTLVAWDGGEAVSRSPIRELAGQLDPEAFAQVHRSVIVNLHQVVEVVRGANETAQLRLRGRNEVLPVSRGYLHLFRQM